MSAEGSRMPGSPVLTVIVALPHGRTNIRRLMRSLAAQSDSSWEAILVGTGVDALAISGRWTRDSRVRVLETGSRGFAEAVNAGIVEAKGNWVIIAPHAARLHPATVTTLAGSSGTDVLYSDEEITSRWGSASRTVRKPDFSPEWLRCTFYLGPSAFYGVGVLHSAGMVREGYAGAELYDLALRAARLSSAIDHVSIPLLSLPQAAVLAGAVETERASPAARRALQDHLDSTGGGAVLESAHGVHDSRRPVRGRPLVSIVVPSRGSSAIVRGELRCMVLDAVRSVIDKSSYGTFEIIIVLDDTAPAGLANELRGIDPRVRVLGWDKPFNFSAKANYGAFCASGDLILFLNDDVEVISPGWLEALIALCQLPNSGMAGAMLYYPDGTIQHAGHVHRNGAPDHVGKGDARGSVGPGSGYVVEREVSGVTAACALVVREAFEAVGGFSLQFPINYNDVDLSLKLAMLGYATYWTPHAELFHYESMTRDALVLEYERAALRSRWAWKLDDLSRWPY